MALEQRVSKLEGAYEQVDGRLSDLSSAVGGVRSEINGLRSDMNRGFNNLYLLMVGGWVTVMATLVASFLAG